LRRMYIVKKLDEIFYRHQLCPFDLWCDLVLGFLYWILFGWLICWWWGVLRSPTTTVLASIGVLSTLDYIWWYWVHWHCVHIVW
jgi:hypothetical protein